MIHIEESRFIQLVQFEKELEQIFEKIVIQYCKDWCALNSERFGWNENKKVVADYINQRIIDNNIIFNSNVPHVWFNSQGSGSMMYWATKDSKTISGIDRLLEPKMEEDLTYKL